MLTASVLMESEWVLRSHYRWSRPRIAKALADLMDLPGAVTVPDQAAWALERFTKGADLADMIHIVGAIGASAFVTFDDYVGKGAGDGSPLPVETLKSR